jgi:hypothetical protein
MLDHIVNLIMIMLTTTTTTIPIISISIISISISIINNIIIGIITISTRSNCGGWLWQGHGRAMGVVSIKAKLSKMMTSDPRSSSSSPSWPSSQTTHRQVHGSPLRTPPQHVML